MPRPPSSHKSPTPKSRLISRQDNYFQRADVIKRNREKRTRYGQFLVEGVAQISIAVEHGWEVAALLLTSGRPLSEWASKLLHQAAPEEVWEVAPDLMALLSEKDETSEVLAILKAKQRTPSDIIPRNAGLVVVFDRPGSPGNLGSSIRSADAFGANGIIVTGHAVDIYDPFVVRGSMGAIFALPVVTAPSHLEVAEWVANARQAGFDYQLVGSSGKTDTLLAQMDFTRPTVLVLGNETVGMSRGYWEIADATVKIPIGGALSSLNVSCAASILLYEVTRQRALAALSSPSSRD
jgi:tRNA G18 (ribose-2'-O)-methylase SpoU